MGDFNWGSCNCVVRRATVETNSDLSDSFQRPFQQNIRISNRFSTTRQFHGLRKHPYTRQPPKPPSSCYTGQLLRMGTIYSSAPVIIRQFPRPPSAPVVLRQSRNFATPRTSRDPKRPSIRSWAAGKRFSLNAFVTNQIGACRCPTRKLKR